MLDNLKKSFSAMSSKPLNILKTSIKSPRNLLVSRIVKPNFCNRSLYDKLLSLVIKQSKYYGYISQIKWSPFKREQFTSYSRLREACHTYLLFLTLNYLHYNSADKHRLKNCWQKFVQGALFYSPVDLPLHQPSPH